MAATDTSISTRSTGSRRRSSTGPRPGPHPASPHRRRGGAARVRAGSRVLAVLLVLAALGSAAVGTGSAALAQGGSSPSADIPSGSLVVPVRVPADTPPPLALASFGVDPAQPGTVLISFAEPFELPDVFRYRVDLRVGQPRGGQERVAVVVEDGEPTGLHETTRTGSGWTNAGVAEFDLDDGFLELRVPADLLEALDEGPAGDGTLTSRSSNLFGGGTGGTGPLAWIEVAFVDEVGGSSTRVASPMVPALELFSMTRDSVAAASTAWGAIEVQPPPSPVGTGVPPRLHIDGSQIVLTFEDSIPGALDGTGVANMVDVVRIAPPGTDHGVAPYFIAIDHGQESVALLDGTAPFPVEVSAPGPWIAEGLPARGVRSGTELRFELEPVLEAFGIEAPDGDPESPEASLGMARSVVLVGGTTVRSEGLVVPVSWTRSSAADDDLPDDAAPADDADEDSSDEVAGGPDAELDDDDGGEGTSEQSDGNPGAGSSNNGRLQLVAIASVVALLGIAGFVALRWSDQRRHDRAAGPQVPVPSRPAEPDEEELERLREFTRQLFEDER